MTAKEIVSQLSLEEKASLCSGRDFWTLKGIDRLGLPAVMVTDGPHGLRKQAGSSDHLGINQSVAATCFPAACASSCSFDRALLKEIGAAMGEECLQEQVSVILGPAANIKRSPLCGRNFEYISEDPFAAGELAAAIIEGIQSKGVGTSLKHYAANNQEKCRMTSNSVIDERTFREIYLAGFEGAVKKAGPWTVMCSYNRINGTYASENKKLLSDILRDEWGFSGLVMTDWGATADRVEGVRAGLDLEMPGPSNLNDAKIVEAVKSGALEEAALDRVVLRVVEMILKSKESLKPGYTYNAEAHHALARRAAADSAVLLKNKDSHGRGILPLEKGKTIAVIGAFAKTPRYQGAGSSKINPSRLDNAWDALNAAGISAEYAPGYILDPAAGAGKSEDELIREATELAAQQDIAVVFVGLPDEYESEGFDRQSLDMPAAHNKLVEAVLKVQPNTVVVLQLGAPVLIPWKDKAPAILAAYLGGQAGGGAITDLLTGARSPSGKLAETWPQALADNPSYHYFGGSTNVEYREGLFVGYRYYDTVGKSVAWPFGYGLSYTKFEYSDLRLDKPQFKSGGTLKATFTVKNSGSREGAEIAQLYVAAGKTGAGASAIIRPVKELKGFEKVFLKAGESKTVTITLDTRSFAYYNAPVADWAVEAGEYQILIGTSSADIRLSGTVTAEGDGQEAALASLKEKAPDYFALPRGELRISDAAFKALYGRELPRGPQPGDPFTVNNTLNDIKETPVGAALFKMVTANAAKSFGEGSSDIMKMVEHMLGDMPLRALGMMSGGQMPPPVIEAVVDALNGKENPIAANILGGLAK
ncbi:glycosyl hydrolase [Spirochaetia bacterium]|nr:glycosyl hydrolase [Spirochaetia bacterium]